jgi:cytochrome b pre-mRNA-processing protein 3
VGSCRPHDAAQMTLFGIFGKSAASEAADHIIAAVTQAARSPDLYGEGGAPDTLDGRFEMMTAFAVLALERLREAPEADRLAQVFTDRLFRHFDAGLREAGVGDLSVSKRMKKLAGAFYGRVASYGPHLQDVPALAAALSRNVWNREDAPFAMVLAERLVGLRARQAKLPFGQLQEASVWV